MENVKTEKTYREERFEFALYVNDNLICKRNFRINNYIEESMQSLDFKQTIDEIVDMIDNDLKSKSRVYTWYYFNEDDTTYDVPSDLKQPLIEPWECTFKFVVTDNKVPVIEKIFDGRGYPKFIREHVDIANKTVKVTAWDGRVLTFDKERFFADNADRLTTDMYVLRAMIIDKPDLLSMITKKICEVCSPRENGYQVTNDYILSEKYLNRNYERDEEGNLKKSSKGKYIIKADKDKTRKYFYSRKSEYKRFVADWGKAVADKTKEYLNTLYY